MNIYIIQEFLELCNRRSHKTKQVIIHIIYPFLLVLDLFIWPIDLFTL